MRPVNLIPSEERSGERRPMRGGPLAYVIVGALAAAVLGVALLTITNNQISDSKAEIASLESKVAAVEARAQSLSAYTQFHDLHQQRVATITSLADSRFDWERVMRELALILPGDVWLTNLSGTASPGVSVEGSSGISLRSGIAGPALEMTGCASGQKAVAGFVQALKEIDGVTRVGMQSSALGEASGSSSGGGSSASGTCQTRNFIAQFQLVVAFDAAPVPPTGEGEGEAVAPPAPETQTTSEGEAGGETQTTSETSGE
ncbi:MAG TPA: PilN domain-containing protein [Solirubrobacterales bacterium]|nr:PilN domain-containing protein [Solirubrobacterales bacterium]